VTRDGTASVTQNSRIAFPNQQHVTRHTSYVTRHTPNVTRHTSHVTRHTSHVTRHTSHVTRHTSHVTPHTSHLTRHLQTRRPPPLDPPQPQKQAAAAAAPAQTSSLAHVMRRCRELRSRKRCGGRDGLTLLYLTKARATRECVSAIA
jgi:hypothetical protein